MKNQRNGKPEQAPVQPPARRENLPKHRTDPRLSPPASGEKHVPSARMQGRDPRAQSSAQQARPVSPDGRTAYPAAPNERARRMTPNTQEQHRAQNDVRLTGQNHAGQRSRPTGDRGMPAQTGRNTPPVLPSRPQQNHARAGQAAPRTGVRHGQPGGSMSSTPPAGARTQNPRGAHGKAQTRVYQMTHNTIKTRTPPGQPSGSMPRHARRSVVSEAREEIRTSALELLFRGLNAVGDFFAGLWQYLWALKPRTVVRVALYGVLGALLAVLQTTVFAQISLFGATPDLLLTYVITIAVYEGAGAAGAAGIFAGFIVESLGSAGLSLMPFIYMLCGYLAGAIDDAYLGRNVPSFLFLAAIGQLIRSFISLIYVASFWNSGNVFSAILYVVLPEFACSVLFGAIPFFLTWLIIRTMKRKENAPGFME